MTKNRYEILYDRKFLIKMSINILIQYALRTHFSSEKTLKKNEMEYKKLVNSRVQAHNKIVIQVELKQIDVGRNIVLL